MAAFLAALLGALPALLPKLMEWIHSLKAEYGEFLKGYWLGKKTQREKDRAAGQRLEQIAQDTVSKLPTSRVTDEWLKK